MPAPTLKNLLKSDKEQFEKAQKEPVDLDKDFQASAARLDELRAGRGIGDIPSNDEYWKAVNKHRLAHNPTNKES